MKLFTHIDPPARRALPALAVALALGLAACGDGSGDAGAGQPAAAAADSKSDKQQVVAAIRDFYDSMYDGDAERFCGSMTEAYQREQSPVKRHNKPCVTIYREMFTPPPGVPVRKGPRKKYEISKVAFDDGIATVTIGRGYGAFDFKLVPDDGRWKLTSPKDALERTESG